MICLLTQHLDDADVASSHLFGCQTGYRHPSGIGCIIATFLLRKDYTCYRLSSVLGCETTDLAGAGLLDTRTGQYSERLLEDYGL